MSDVKGYLESEEIKRCPQRLILALSDALNVVNGKWKLPIIASLFHGKTRFKDLQQNIEKITPRMLSKELKELEVNELVERCVYATTPVTVEYRLSDYGQTLSEVMIVLRNWGLNHRQRMMMQPTPLDTVLTNPLPEQAY